MENAIKIQIPISVSYPALEGLLKQQMLGEYLPPAEEGSNEAPYAHILDIGIEGNPTAAYDLNLSLRIRILRTVLKRERVDLLVRAKLGYHNETQELFVRTFHLDSRTSSGFYNTSLEVLANKVAYNQVLKKARINLRELITKEVKKANGLLENGFELKGLKLKGAAELVRVQDISLQPESISLVLELEGKLEAEIFDLLSLMPPK